MAALSPAATAHAHSALAAPETAAPIPPGPLTQADTQPTRLTFICPEGAPQASFERMLAALRGELADLPATVIAVCNGRPGPLPARVDQASESALANGSLAAIWLDQEGESLVLYFVDPEERSVRSRAIATDGDAESTAHLDSLAVITRSALDALRRSRAGRRRIDPQPPPPPVTSRRVAVEPPPVEPTPAPRGHLRLLFGYTGSRYAPGVPWQSGISLAITYLWPQGVFAGAAYLVTSPISLDPYPLGGDDFIFGKIRRRPATLLGGYQRLWPVAAGTARIGLEAEFGATVDVLAARTPVVCIDSAGDYCQKTHALERSDPLLFNLGFAPRLRFLLEPTPAILVYFGGGLDFFGDQTVYANCVDKTCPGGLLFDPFNLRPLAQAGFIFRI